MKKQINVDVRNERVTVIIESTGAHETYNFQEAGLYDDGEAITDGQEISEILTDREETWNPEQQKTWQVNIHFLNN